MLEPFAAKIDKWASKSERRTTAVFRTALENMAEEADTPIARGGHMPVDTGFLRASMMAAIGRSPTGPSDPRVDAKGGEDDISLVIAGAEIGDEVHIGWTAVYARAMNAMYGYRDLAAQRWGHFVRDAVREAKRRVR